MAIVTMRHLTLLVLQEERVRLLRALQHAGCVQIEPLSELREKEVLGMLAEAPSAPSETRRGQQTLLQARDYLKQCGVRFPLLQKRTKVPEERLLSRCSLEETLKTGEKINRLGRSMEEHKREREQLEERRRLLEHWTACPAPLGSRGTETTQLLYGTLPFAVPWTDFTHALAQAAPASAAFVLAETKQRHYTALLCHRGSLPLLRPVLQKNGFREAQFPPDTGSAAEELESVKARCALLERQDTAAAAKIAAMAEEKDALELALDQITQRLLLEEAQERFGTLGAVAVLHGWIPAEREDALARTLAPFACAWQTADAAEDEHPPVLLKNPRWMKPIQVITEMYVLPDYRGIDPNPLIFGFYIFFFGFMFADAAYGLLLFAAAQFVIRKWDPRGTFGQLMYLGRYLGLSTCVCGILTGGFFGNAIEVIAANFFGLPMTALPPWIQRFSAGLVFNPLTEPMAVLYAALLIGVVQLVFGQFVHIYMEARDGHPAAGLMDTVPWWVFFAGIALWLADRGGAVFLIGTVLLIVTQGRRKKGIPAKLLGGVASLYGVTNWLSDVLSYSRLMALMLATSVIATVINTLGALPGSLAAFIPIFIIGHVFNIGVNLIGTYVHAARLQYLEFYGKFYREGGTPFRPLAYRTNYTDVIKEEQDI